MELELSKINGVNRALCVSDLSRRRIIQRETSRQRNVLVANGPDGEISGGRNVLRQTGKQSRYSTFTLRLASLQIAAFWIIGPSPLKGM